MKGLVLPKEMTDEADEWARMILPDLWAKMEGEPLCPRTERSLREAARELFEDVFSDIVKEKPGPKRLRAPFMADILYPLMEYFIRRLLALYEERLTQESKPS